GDRGSYRQWEEENIVPQVVFEILSPGNRPPEMARKQQFYDNYGVDEYYIYDPDRNNLQGLRRVGEKLQEIEEMNNWTSPRLGIRFVLTPETLELYRPDNRKFLTTQELEQRAEEFQQQAQQERLLTEQERQRAADFERQAQQERLRAEQERERAERLAAQLRELGIDPDA
ncbi:MAG: Uma2 family endonuclease, partial [Jaaginema sp. PMC 1080.18]|nr:Uma2 family endonuclease [Jaaginema sp. PMC 1080.18]